MGIDVQCGPRGLKGSPDSLYHNNGDCTFTDVSKKSGVDDPEHRYDGYSGATLVRPALDRLRDLVNVGAIDRICIHSPDRLSRNYAYQVLLLDEWRLRGVEVVFSNRSRPGSGRRPPVAQG